MNIFTFLFVVSTYFLFLIFSSFTEISLESQILFASFFILLIGIPHGAIDHILFFKKRSFSQLKFYSIYLGLILLFLLLWIFFPFWSLLLFLLISAFHFGESQFSDIKAQKLLRYSLFPFWGIALLSTLMHYNLSEIIEITTFFEDTNDLKIIYNDFLILRFFQITNVCTILLLFLLAVKRHIKRNFVKFHETKQTLQNPSIFFRIISIAHSSYHFLFISISNCFYNVFCYSTFFKSYVSRIPVFKVR